MEKIKTMKAIQVSSIFLSCCVFFNATAFGIKTILRKEVGMSNNWMIQSSSELTHYYSMHNNNVSDEVGQLSLSDEVQESNIDLQANFLPDGGPDQPEVKSFTPIGTSDMVNPFTGDFSYNVPLMDVDGYPLNIAYTAGVTMDQEASWVGLGWNLNPGVINRTLRGMPDEFDGNDYIEKDFNLKKNWTVGGAVSADFELFGFGSDVITATPQGNDTSSANNFSLSASLGVSYNNYTGYSSTISLGPSLSFSQNNGGLTETIGLGFSSSSSGGASLSPTIGFKKNHGNKVSKLNIGTSINSREGLSNATVSFTRTKEQKKTFTDKKGKEQEITVQRNLPISSSFNFGQTTHIPYLTMPFRTHGQTFSFKYGFDAIGSDVPVEFSGSYNVQWLAYKHKVAPAFGYMNLEKGVGNDNALLDFNRENEGPFTPNIAVLPMPNLTYDLFNVSGQGVSGSYRPFRKDVGHVFDPTMNNYSENGSIGVEAGMGGTFKGGIDISETFSSSYAADWSESGNTAKNRYNFGQSGFYFREANEKSVDSDPNHFNKIGGAKAVRFDVDSYRSIRNKLDDTQGNFYGQDDLVKTGSDRRNQVVYTLTNGELKNGLGIEQLHPSAMAWDYNNMNHHIGQFTVLNVEGSRYVYGIAAYSHYQKDVSFAAAKNSNDHMYPVDFAKGLIQYDPGVDDSGNNDRGTDNYFNSVKTPSFVHSYLLTTVLNADYVDADNITGPSKGDLGGYLKFDYNKINNYHWRNPINQNKASFDEGLNADNMDDKAHYIAGEKELWYVKTIKSKNHIAIFHTSNRADGVSANSDDNGGLNTAQNAPSMQELDSIQLFSLADYEANPTLAVPIKTVHFQYDYSLCSGYDANINGGGKLTLKKIFFTYQNTNKGRYTPYSFNYGQQFGAVVTTLGDTIYQVIDNINPTYAIKSMDRWNNYKPQSSFTNSIETDPLRNSDFPYVGFNKQSTNKAMIAWNLTTINLPSGGKIEVDYESDSYAYVQNKRANQMFKIIAVESCAASNSSQNIHNPSDCSITDFNSPNPFIYVELMPDPSSPTGYNENLNDYVQPDQQIYFRTLMKFGGGRYDFVPGYAYVSSNSANLSIVPINGVKAIKMKLVGARLLDNGSSDYNPIAVAAIQYARLNLSSLIYSSPSNEIAGNASITSLVESMGTAITNMSEIFIGPNYHLWAQDIGTTLVTNNSWVRLQNPNKNKLGGGHRVKEIRMYDAWDEMTNQEMPENYYGQRYEYTLNDGSSSGVAAYEPEMGGDENPWRQPVFYNKEILLAPDIKNFQETPFGEQFFPSPSVGYSMVTVKNLPKNGVLRTATGKVVNEFYTAKDFPTLVGRTEIDNEKFRIPTISFFLSIAIDEATASQGFVVENNDMHGKEKRTSVYAENQSEPITKVEYFYLTEPLSGSSTAVGINTNINQPLHLLNKVKSIKKDGTLSESTIGLVYEGFADFRKSSSNTISGSANINTNYTTPFLLIPTLSGSGSYERTAFRSATFTKVIERFGILAKTVATDLGSVVETNNLAYDAETGAVLLTETTTDFNDKVYNFTYPAHWYYNEMGQAYKNIDNVYAGLNFINGGTAQVNNAQYAPGDEVAIYNSQDVFVAKGWVTEASQSGIRILLKNGLPLTGNVLKLKTLRSGRRNLQTTPVGTLVLRENPLNHLTSNVFEKVLQASAIEYSDEWRTFCECFATPGQSSYTTNPFVLGTKGIWRPKASYVHLSGRSQTFENENSNIRQDGVFTSFSPFYKLAYGKWGIDRQDWTYTSSVVEFSPFGQALETIDALNRYSSSMYGYNQTLATAVSMNTRYRQLGFTSFEDYNYPNCSDNHFKIGTASQIVSSEAHTGRKSIRVNAGTSISYTTNLTVGCEPAACKVQANLSVKTIELKNYSTETTLTASGGVAPYQYEYQIVSGQAIVDFNNNGDALIIQHNLSTASNPSLIRVTITDAKGCQTIVEI